MPVDVAVRLSAAEAENVKTLARVPTDRQSGCGETVLTRGSALRGRSSRLDCESELF